MHEYGSIEIKKHRIIQHKSIPYMVQTKTYTLEWAADYICTLCSFIY